MVAMQGPQLWVKVEGPVRLIRPKAFPNIARYIVDANYGHPAGEGKKKAKALLITLSFGYPLSNVNKEWNGLTKAAKSHFKKWVHAAYHDYLWDLQEQKPEDMTITYKCLLLEGQYVGSLVAPDMLFLLFAMAYIYLFVVLMKCSFFLASMAVSMILLSAVPTLLLYRWIFQQTYPVVIINWVQYLGPPVPFSFPDSRDLLEVLGGLSWQRERERGGSLGDPPGP